jgi:outer membrane receptor protein involved in Fe transport
MFVGNPDLKMSRLRNYDARLELRPDKRSVDIIAVGVFYKTIRDPIQYSTREGPAGGDMDLLFPENYGPAKIKGLEFELRKDFGFVAEALRDLSIGGNLTLQRSEVYYRSDMTNDLRRAQVKDEKRPMDGQSDILANVNIVFDNDYTGLSLGVFYNWRGEMILSGDTATSTKYYPSIVEEGIGTLDITLGYKFKVGESAYSPEWRLGFEVKNILNPAISTVYRTPVKDIQRSRYKNGRTYGVSLGCSW